MTDDEMIAVIQAHKEGKIIQYRLHRYGQWMDPVLDEEPDWNFYDFEYRIKPEPPYRPFESIEEVIDAMKEHGDWVKTTDGTYVPIVRTKKDRVGRKVNFQYKFFEDALRTCTFADGTPFGVKEE